METAPEWREIVQLSKKIEPDGTAYFDELVTQYFKEQLRQAGNKLTPEILKHADQLYDVMGMSTVLATALGISSYDIKVALGHPTKISCRECGTRIDAYELRKQGGYWVPALEQRNICPACRKKERQEHRSERDETADAYREAWQSRAAVDAQLASATDPLTVKFFRDHLTLIHKIWEEGFETEIYEIQEGFTLAGCMICGQLSRLQTLLAGDSIQLANPIYTALTGQVDNQFWGFEWQQYSYMTESLSLPVPTRVAQVVWRFSPSSYWRLLGYLPVFRMPIVLLCQDCARFVPSTYSLVKETR